MEAYHDHDEAMQSARQQRRLQRTVAPPTLPPPPDLITLVEPTFLSLPSGLAIRLDIYEELATLHSGLESMFHTVFCHLGFESWMSTGTIFESVKLYSSRRWGSDGIEARVFMHLERLEAKQILADKGGFVVMRHTQSLWRSVAHRLKPMATHLDEIVKRCYASAIDGERLAVSTLQLAQRNWHNLASLASALDMGLEEEINLWCAAGQWTAGSSSSIQAALDDVCTFVLVHLFQQIFDTSIVQFVQDDILKKHFTNRRNSFTVHCLMPGQWVNDDIINFFVDQWQPSSSEGVFLFDTRFWSWRLRSISTLADPADDGKWKQLFKHKLFKVPTTQPSLFLSRLVPAECLF